mgnify:CR=1 FL=1
MFKKFKQITTKSDRFSLILLFLILILSTLIELIGIGSIPIFAMIIVNPDNFINTLSNFSDISFINNFDRKSLTLYSAIILLLIFLIKNFYLVFVSYFNNLVVKKIRVNINYNLFQSYIGSSYEFHINRNPAQLIRNITSEITKSVYFIMSFIMLIKESLIMIMIFLMLVIVDPQISFLIFFLLGVVTFIFFLLSRRGSKKRGERIQEYWGRQIKALNHALGSIKETKILNKEKFMFNLFKTNTDIIEEDTFYQSFIVTLPRLFLEIMAILTVVIVSVSFVFLEKPFENFIPLIALITVASVRLIPSFNTISSSIATMKYQAASFKQIADELVIMKEVYSSNNNLEGHTEKKKIIFKDKLEIKNVDYYYPKSKSKVFNQAFFTIKCGDIIGISGPSGVGKSTLVDLMTGLLKPSSGQILVDGFDINKSSNNWQQQIGYVPQDIYLLDETIKANISFGTDKKEFNEENFHRAIELAQLKDFIKSLPDKENTQVGDRGIRLSGGQKQRIGIARSLYFKPKILIFDEPTSALDVENEKKIIDDLYKLSGQLTIIIVSHRQTVFDKCSKVLQIENGKIEEKINQNN